MLEAISVNISVAEVPFVARENILEEKKPEILLLVFLYTTR